MPRGICYFRSVWPTAAAARSDAVSWAVVATVVWCPPKSPTAHDSLCKRTVRYEMFKDHVDEGVRFFSLPLTSSGGKASDFRCCCTKNGTINHFRLN